jgi:bacterioferritin-associated ferredoxin
MELPSTNNRVCADPCPGPCSGCPDRVVCRCLKVTEAAVVDAIVTLGLRTVKELRTATGAGDGCTCCHRELRELLEVHAEVRVEARVASTL